MIRKCFDPVVVTPHKRSKDIEEEFRLTRDIKGNVSYVKVGEHSISEYVGSFEKGCSLRSILERSALMPVRERAQMLQQRESGLYGDVSNLPKDLTDAMIQLDTLKRENPALFDRFARGESFNDIVNSMIKSKESEVNDNGKNEPGNE